MKTHRQASILFPIGISPDHCPHMDSLSRKSVSRKMNTPASGHSLHRTIKIKAREQRKTHPQPFGTRNVMGFARCTLAAVPQKAGKIQSILTGAHSLLEKIQFTIDGVQSVLKRVQFHINGVQSVIKRILFHLDGVQSALKRMLFDLDGVQSFSKRMLFHIKKVQVNASASTSDLMLKYLGILRVLSQRILKVNIYFQHDLIPLPGGQLAKARAAHYKPKKTILLVINFTN